MRIRLKMPVALPIFTWEMRDMVRVVRATKVAAQAEALDEPGPPGGGEIDLGIILAHEINGQSVDQQSHEDQDAAVHDGGEAAHHRHDHEGADAAEGQGPARQGGVIAHEGLEEQGQEHDAAVKDEPEEEHDGHPGGVIPLLEEAQVHHGVLGLQLPPDQDKSGPPPR